MTGSPYTVDKTGKLVGARLVIAGDAVTSLIEMVVIKLSCKSWGGREVILSQSGNQIRTAPAMHIPPADVALNMDAPLGAKIEAQYKHETGATPVTPRISVTLVFEN